MVEVLHVCHYPPLWVLIGNSASSNKRRLAPEEEEWERQQRPTIAAPLVLRRGHFVAWVVCGQRQPAPPRAVPPAPAASAESTPLTPARTCGFKAALPRQRLRFCAIPSNVAVRSYDGALRSSMVEHDAADVKKMYHLLSSLLSAVSQLWKATAYHPERHYMRGPGPKWREKH
jgi:hypothetical protein